MPVCVTQHYSLKCCAAPTATFRLSLSRRLVVNIRTCLASVSLSLLSQSICRWMRGRYTPHSPLCCTRPTLPTLRNIYASDPHSSLVNLQRRQMRFCLYLLAAHIRFLVGGEVERGGAAKSGETWGGGGHCLRFNV